jgi:hypothetical protein
MMRVVRILYLMYDESGKDTSDLSAHGGGAFVLAALARFTL